KDVAVQWKDEKAPRLAAAVSFYTIFSLPPLLIVTIAIASLFFGEAAVQGRLVNEMQTLMGQDGAMAIQSIIQNANEPGSNTGLAAIGGILVLLIGASGVFAQLQDALNTIWGI